MYNKRCSRAEPGLIVFVLDDSESMADPLEQTTDSKWKYVERFIGVILKELMNRSTELKGDAVQIKPRYYVYAIVYGSHPQVWGPGEMDIKVVVEKYAHDGESFGLGGHLGGTCTIIALQKAYEFLKEAMADPRFQSSFPPMLLHITDGMSDADPTPVAEMIKQLSNNDGNVLFANAYIGTETALSYKGPDDFPGYVGLSDVGPNNEDNVRLFNMSSEMPDCIRQNLIDDGIFPNLREGSRLFFDVRTKEMLKHAIQIVGSLGSRADRTGR